MVLEPQILPHHELFVHHGNRSNIAVLRDNEADTSRYLCTIPHHGAMTRAILIVVNSTQSLPCRSAISCHPYSQRFFRKSDFHPKPFYPKILIQEYEPI